MKLVLSLLLAFTAISATAHEDAQPVKNTLSWFEIPVTDLSRAVTFYNALLQVGMTEDKSTPVPMAFFPNGGALIQMNELKPGPDGVIVYLDAGEDLQLVLDRVEPNGGKVLVAKTKISDTIGFFAVFIDTEGNRLGLFSPK